MISYVQQISKILVFIFSSHSFYLSTASHKVYQNVSYDTSLFPQGFDVLMPYEMFIQVVNKCSQSENVF